MIETILRDVGLINIWLDDVLYQSKNYPNHVLIFNWMIMFTILLFTRNKKPTLFIFAVINIFHIFILPFRQYVYYCIFPCLLGCINSYVFIKLLDMKIKNENEYHRNTIIFIILLYISSFGSGEIIMDNFCNIGLLRSWLIICFIFFCYCMLEYKEKNLIAFWNSDLYDFWITNILWYISVSFVILFHYYFIFFINDIFYNFVLMIISVSISIIICVLVTRSIICDKPFKITHHNNNNLCNNTSRKIVRNKIHVIRDINRNKNIKI